MWTPVVSVVSGVEAEQWQQHKVLKVPQTLREKNINTLLSIFFQVFWFCFDVFLNFYSKKRTVSFCCKRRVCVCLSCQCNAVSHWNGLSDGVRAFLLFKWCQ